MRSRVFPGTAAAAVLAVAVWACGGGGNSGNPGGPSPGAGPSPTTTPPGAVNATTITIANNTATPKDIIVARGTQVTFINNDATTHDMESNPHPGHTDCPEINLAGFLSAGQTKQTAAMNTARVCGYHDHERESVVGLQGTITVQ